MIKRKGGYGKGTDSMQKAECTAEFGSSVDKIWDIMTNNANYGWRSDISDIVVQDGGNTFTEYTKKGYSTVFTVTLKIPHERYEFDMKNDAMSGHFTAVFLKVNGRTRLTLTEEVEAVGAVKKMFAGMYLKKHQKTYVSDLRKALGEDV